MALVAIDGAFTDTGRMVVLLGTTTQSIVIVSSEDDVEDSNLQQVLPSVPILMAVSASGDWWLSSH